MIIEVNGKKIETDVYVKKWTDWALEATPATNELIEKNIQILYKKAGFDKPAIKIFREWDDFLNFDWDSLRASMWDSVGDSVKDSVWTSVWDSVKDSVGASMWDSLRASVWDSVWDSLRVSVKDSVWASVKASVRASVKASVGSWYWADDLAFMDVLVALGVLDEKKHKELLEFKQLLETQRLGVLTKKCAYILVAPAIRRNQRGFLHSDTLPAVQWGKSGLYYLNGVAFQKDLWEQVISRAMSLPEIATIKNIEQRTQAMRYSPPKEFLNQVGKLLDISERKNELYLIPSSAGIFPIDAFYLLYKDSSTERWYMKGIDPEVGKKGNADEAQAWSHSFELKEYLQIIET